jgi:hypothetical protein
MRTALAASIFVMFAVAAPAADMFAGTWKGVPAKSTNNWGQKPPQSITRTYTVNPKGGYDVKVEGVDADGKPISNSLQAGGNVEVSTSNSTAQVVKALGATHVVSRRVNDHTLVATYKKDGKEVGTSTSTVSKDGKTLTMKLSGTSTEGKKLSGTNVYEKQ